MKSGCTGEKVTKKRSIKLPVISNSAAQKGDIRASRTSRWRAVALVTLNLLMIAHIIQWRFMGQTITPIEPSESMFTLQNGAVNAGFIFFALAILATLVFGRFACGWGCHILALQDFCGWLLKKFGLTPKPFRRLSSEGWDLLAKNHRTLALVPMQVWGRCSGAWDHERVIRLDYRAYLSNQAINSGYVARYHIDLHRVTILAVRHQKEVGC